MMGRGSARLAVQQHAALIRTIFLSRKALGLSGASPHQSVALS
jgi:hypothetical protein